MIAWLNFEKVRELGRILDVPEPFLKRHPFPGPGLAVRVLGDVTEGNALDILRQVHGNLVESLICYLCSNKRERVQHILLV